ncbi:MAG TPA: hypothetical protein VFW96_00215, partial [Thermomicrobiales bacterium]|nr:hypothetical protein [Thermomicrobiales bacterium]
HLTLGPHDAPGHREDLEADLPIQERQWLGQLDEHTARRRVDHPAEDGPTATTEADLCLDRDPRLTPPLLDAGGRPAAVEAT